ncbi:putative effector protein [Ceratobasidium theobromae]|uniref:Putative effector protein n=1 Tax=Ceratobasidium theobromae TaxID=1582974 RepID=A0A5N5QK52_9AGAM|nr:putative effector protein [Ceratobasidium theobromae]
MYSFTKFVVSAACALAFSGIAVAIPSNMRAHQLHAARAKGGRNGQATYYNTEENNGACGWYNKNNEHVIAISQGLWDETSNGQGGSSSCGRTANINYQGKSVTVTVVDLCPECAYNDIDMSPSAFEALENKDAGRLHVSWKFN